MKRIFLPIEIKVREFHSKLLFALFAAERGIETILGGQLELIDKMHKFGKGLYIDKSTAITKPEWFTRCRALGNYVSAWDEEGLIYLSDEVYHGTRMDDEAFALTDLFFAWGDSLKRTIVNKYPSSADRVVSVGNPRIDLLRPEFRGYCDSRVAELQKKYGKMILINTNFALHNFAKGKEAAAAIFDPYPLGDQKELLKGWYAFQEKGYEGFVEASKVLHEHFPEHTIIVRPAPAEDIKPWQELAEGRDRMVISKEGNVVEWIRAADAVVQFNCTTGVEAYMLDVPTIAYRCVLSEDYETPVSIACSTQAFTLDELLAVLERAVEKDPSLTARDQKDQALIKDHITNADGPTSCEQILDEIQKRDFKERSYTLVGVPLIKRVWRAWLGVVRRDDPADVAFYRTKFPGLTLEEAKSVAASFTQATGRFKNVEISSVGTNIIRTRPS